MNKHRLSQQRLNQYRLNQRRGRKKWALERIESFLGRIAHNDTNILSSKQVFEWFKLIYKDVEAI